MGRKPKYENPEETIQAFFASVSESNRHPSAGEEGRIEGQDGTVQTGKRKKQELLAEEFGISRIKVRKILITTGDLHYSDTARIQELIKSGLKMPNVADKLGISLSTANSLLPYSKGVYKLSEVSAAADRTKTYRERKAALAELKEKMDGLGLWKTVCLFAGYPFTTSGRGKAPGSPFKYCVSEPGSSGGRHYDGEDVEGYGNEMFIVQNGEKREKGISRSSVDYAFRIAREIVEKGGVITGPKQLKVYGSSYIYALFVRFGLITFVE